MADHAATDAAESQRWNNTLRYCEDVLTSSDKKKITDRGVRNMGDKKWLEMVMDFMHDEFEDIQRNAEA